MEESFRMKGCVNPANLQNDDDNHHFYIDVKSMTPSSFENGCSLDVNTTSKQLKLMNLETNPIASDSDVSFNDRQTILETMELRNFTGLIRLIQAPKKNQDRTPVTSTCCERSVSGARLHFSPDVSNHGVELTSQQSNQNENKIIESKMLERSDDINREQHIDAMKSIFSRSTDKLSHSSPVRIGDDTVRMPQSVRQIRIKRRKRLLQSDDNASQSGESSSDNANDASTTNTRSIFPTMIHWLCTQTSISNEQIEVSTLLSKESIAKSCQIVDTYDSLPIHLIGNNEQLICTSPDVVKIISCKLLQAHPTSITCIDMQHRMPFISMIEDWYYYHLSSRATHQTSKTKNTRAQRFFRFVSKSKNNLSTHESVDKKKKSFSIFQQNNDQELKNSFSIEENDVSAIDTIVKQTDKKKTRVDKLYIKFPSSDAVSNDPSRTTTSRIGNIMVKSNIGTSPTYLELSNPSSQDDSLCCSNISNEDEKLAMANVASVRLWVEIDFCFRILSTALSIVVQYKQNGVNFENSKGGVENDDNVSNKVEEEDPVTLLVQHILQVLPNILYIILLIDNENDRNRILQYPITQHMLLCPASVGPWFTMLLRRQWKCSRAVDYLYTISNLSLSMETTCNVKDKYNDFCRAQRSVFLALKRTPKTIALLSLLENKELERALKTEAIQYIVSKSLSRSFLVGMVLIEFTLHFTLMEAFRSTVFVPQEYNEFRPMFGTVPLNIVILICCNDLIRKGCEAVSLLFLSTGSIRTYFSNFRTIFDVMTTVLVLCTVISRKIYTDQSFGTLSTVVTAMLWIRVLSYLKVFNEQMALFVAAMGQIIVDARFFGVVLIVLIFMFADMMQILVTSKDDGEYCEMMQSHSEPLPAIIDFCSGSRSAALLRIYSVLFGAFDLNDYKETLGLSVLFVAYTLIGIIILLTVLIAVISASYEKSRQERENLFRIARIQFVAQYETLEEFLQPGTDLFDRDQNGNRTFRSVFRWIVLVSFVSSAFIAELFLFSSISRMFEKDESLSISYLICIMLLSLILGVALWIVTRFAIVGVIRQCAHISVYRSLNASERYTTILVKQLSYLLFGKSCRASYNDEKRDDCEKSGHSNTTYFEKKLEQSLLRIKDELKTEIQKMESRLATHNK